MTTKIQTHNGESSQRFISYIQEGIKAWTKAAELAREEIEKNPDWPEEVESACKFITSHAVRRFALIGLKFIPELAIDECSGAKRLRKLPLETQRKYYTEQLPVLIDNRGNWDCLNVDIHNLTTEQAEQVFADDHVRTDAEQRAFIESKRLTKHVTKMPNLPYRIVGKEVVFLAGTRMTRQDLKRLLAQL